MSKEPSLNDFGLLIAYVLPGFTALWGATYLTPALDPWLGSPPQDAPTVGGFLYLTVAAIAAGLTVSTVRWLLLDTLHHCCGIRPPDWDFSQLRGNAAAFGVVVEHYYRYYQWYSNMVVSLLLVFAARRWSLGVLPGSFDWPDGAALTLIVVFFIASRDSLRRYYTRGGQLLRKQSGGRERHRTRKATVRPVTDAEGVMG